MDDVPLAAIVAVRRGRAGYEGDEEVIPSGVVADAVGGPKRSFRAGVLQAESAFVDPGHPLVARLGHADLGSVSPLDAGQVEPCPALRIEDRPHLPRSVPHHDRIGRAVVDRITVERRGNGRRDRGRVGQRFGRLGANGRKNGGNRQCEDRKRFESVHGSLIGKVVETEAAIRGGIKQARPQRRITASESHCSIQSARSSTSSPPGQGQSVI